MTGKGISVKDIWGHLRNRTANNPLGVIELMCGVAFPGDEGAISLLVNSKESPERPATAKSDVMVVGMPVCVCGQ